MRDAESGAASSTGMKRSFGFECPSCGDERIVEADSPDELKSSVYGCGNCGENVLLDNYLGER